MYECLFQVSKWGVELHWESSLVIPSGGLSCSTRKIHKKFYVPKKSCDGNAESNHTSSNTKNDRKYLEMHAGQFTNRTAIYSEHLTS